MARAALAAAVIAVLGAGASADSGAVLRSGVLVEIWRGIEGDLVSDLTGSSRYQAAPDELRLLPTFGASGLGDRYGSRWTALLSVPTTGDYRFYVASDDGGGLWLSPDGSEAGLRRIAEVSGYSEPEDWTAQPGQRSATVSLAAGQVCLLRALQKQGGGGNHLSVAWEGPGIERSLLGGSVLTPPSLSEEQRATLVASARAEAIREELLADAAPYRQRGETLPLAITQRLLPPVGQPGANDTGINVLIDEAHQTQFAVLWGMHGALSSEGFRACTSVASLGGLLEPGSPARIRLPMGELEPFAWWPTPEWNVVITSQQDLEAQPYTEAEREALLDFVRAGGGLLIFGGRPGTEPQEASWSLNELLAPLGAAYGSAKAAGSNWSALALRDGWEVLARSEGGDAIRARRSFGAGRVLLAEGSGPLNPDGEKDPAVATAKRRLLRDSVLWCAGGKAPVGGSPYIPDAGGVGIYPECEEHVAGLVVYYAANQKADVLETIRERLPKAADAVRAWFPTVFADEPYNIVLCAGGGGGWAINGRPKAAAVIDYDPLSLLGVFAHEMAHTMAGPRNDAGAWAGFCPHGNQGEDHAGWFQGKVLALFSEEARAQSNRNCNSILDLEARKGRKLDLATENETELGRAFWGYGPGWTKMWYVFAKLDDRYGPTWYPRWYWVRSTRWAEEPSRQLSWTEVVEDMSIAVGEDLFPFFASIGTTLGHERFPRAEFEGTVLELPVAPIDDGPAGNANLDPIGDYRQPLPRPR